tara:strand:+ start:1371 stop:2687 length:1317 start_codon:yes stop_codon:yes gene_type:complete
MFVLFYSVFSNDEEMRLKSQLLDNYDTTTIPKLKEMNPIELQLGIAIRAFENIDQVEGTILSNVWLRYYWNDYRLKWDSDYWNISRIIMYSDPEADNVIWTPDIYLYNTAENPLEQLKHSRIIVYSSGDIIWSRPGILKSTCKFNLEYYPFDLQRCHLRFGSWVYSGLDLNLTIHESEIDIGNMQLNEEWKLINKTSIRNEKKYKCCPETYPDIVFEFFLKRYSQHYTSNIIIPTIATSSLMIISLLVPWDSGERISFVTTVMLSIIVFLLLLSENLPKTDSNPFLSRLTLGLTIFSLISVFFTVIISSLYTHKKKRGIIYRLLKLCKLKDDTCYNNETASISSKDNISKNTENEIRLRTFPSDEFDVDEVINALEVSNFESINQPIETNKIENTDQEKIKDGELDCETTAGNVEAIFTLIFFVSFLIYLIYMFAILQ